MICHHCNGSFAPEASGGSAKARPQVCPDCASFLTAPAMDDWTGPTIEAVALPASRNGRPRRLAGPGPGPRTARSAAFPPFSQPAIAAALLLVCVAGGAALHRPIGRAVAEAAGLAPKFDGFAFRDMRSETRPMRDGTALMVEGELVNMTGTVAPLPAIRLSLRAGRTEVYGWSVELTRASLAPGETIAFRSLVPAPAGAAGDVVASLEPQGGIVGLR